MGFAMLGLLPLPFLDRTFAPAVEPALRSGSPLLLGGAFGVCFNALRDAGAGIAAGTLGRRGNGRSCGRAAGRVRRRAGVAVPAGGCRAGPHDGAVSVLRDRYDLVRMASGAVLVAAGLLVFFDRTTS